MEDSGLYWGAKNLTFYEGGSCRFVGVSRIFRFGDLEYRCYYFCMYSVFYSEYFGESDFF